MKRILMFILLITFSNIQSQWEHITAPSSSYVKDIKTVDNNIFVITRSTSDSLFFFSTEGNTWTYINLGADIRQINSPVQKDNFIFVACDSGIFRSSDLGSNWENKNNGLPYDKYDYPKYIYSLTVIDTTLYVVTSHQELYYSRNNGEQWTPTTFSSSAYCVDSNGKDLFCGSYGLYIAPSDWIFVSSDSGITWLPINSGLPGSYVYSLAFYNSKLFSGIYSWAGETNSGVFTKGEGIYISSDNGITWEQGNNGLDDLGITKFLKTPKRLFTATNNSGLYFYKDETDKWISITKDLPYSPEYTIATNDTDLFVGTYYNGIYKCPLSEITTSIEQLELPISFSLSQNYPNPFNPTTTINYQIPSAGHVSLKVYDILGREIATLVNEEKPTRNYEIKFDGSNLSSGIYFYRLESGSFYKTKKFILLK